MSSMSADITWSGWTDLSHLRPSSVPNEARYRLRHSPIHEHRPGPGSLAREHTGAGGKPFEIEGALSVNHAGTKVSSVASGRHATRIRA